MNCSDCIKLNAIPGCIDTDAFLLTGLTFPDHESQTITGLFQDKANGRNVPIEIVVDDSGVPTIDIAEFYRLDDHPYEVRFLTADGVPANFLLTNPDSTTEEGCCVSFKVIPGIIASDTWVLSSQACTVSA